MFRQHLQKLMDRLDGGVAAVLMDFDGIVVESCVRDAGSKPDLQTIAMELTHLVAQLRRSAQGMELGTVRELIVRTEKLTVVFHLLTDKHFLACAVTPAGNVGKARYLVRLAAPQIHAEL
jgi:predicted regulator of Ras-like GTPase activity (Roadblock/LC7/MglB family)